MAVSAGMETENELSDAELDAALRDTLTSACPGLRISEWRPLHAGYTSKQWVAETDEGPLLVKVPQRNRDPEHLRHLIACTRVAAEHGIPVVRFRALVTDRREFGGPVLIQEFQDGEAAGRAWEELDEASRLALCAELGTVTGRMHAASGQWFGDVLGASRMPSLRPAVEAELDELLRQAEAAGSTGLGAGADPRAVVSAVLSGLDAEASVPALTHGDLWLPNILLRGGRIGCVLDFEHGLYADRFRDFGKLDEHVFDGFPAGRPVFLDAYAAACPLPADWEARLALAHLMHSLYMHVYFLTWTPQWAPQYATEFHERLAKIS